MDFFVAASQEHQKRERAKARELRRSQWWRQQLGPGLCHYCGQRFEREELTMDHVLPIARGGRTTKRNVVVSCKSCNVNKGHQTAVDRAFEARSSDLS